MMTQLPDGRDAFEIALPHRLVVAGQVPELDPATLCRESRLATFPRHDHAEGGRRKTAKGRSYAPRIGKRRGAASEGVAMADDDVSLFGKAEALLDAAARYEGMSQLADACRFHVRRQSTASSFRCVSDGVWPCLGSAVSRYSTKP
jgi:hypothetical protein